MKKVRKLIVIVGPTASGKSDLAKYICQKFNGEAISADSRQIYKGMDIGTGKDKSFFQYMIDICEPDRNYSVAEYQKKVYKIIEGIFKRGKIPIIVGGTGLYIDAVIYGYKFPKTNLRLRSKIEKLSKEEIYNKLKQCDPISAEKNKTNHRRLVRALESYLYNLRPLSEYKKKKPNFDYLILGIDIPRKKLYEKIDRRVDERIKQGMIAEVENLLKSSVSHERMQRFGLEYRYIDDYLQGKLKKKEMIQKLKYRIHDFARRQLTWFRKNKEIIWIKDEKEAENLIKNFLSDRIFLRE